MPSMRVEYCGCTFHDDVLTDVCDDHKRDHAANWREILKCPACVRKPCKDHCVPGNERLVPGGE